MVALKTFLLGFNIKQTKTFSSLNGGGRPQRQGTRDYYLKEKTINHDGNQREQ